VNSIRASQSSTCAVKGAGPQRVQIPPGNWFAPPGSNRSSSGGNEAAEASAVEGRERRLGKFAGCNICERCAGPETGDAGADPPRNEGKPRSMGRTSERFLSVLPGYWRRHADKKGTRRNTGSPSGDRSRDQPATRESEAGPSGVAERPVVLRKPGNAGGGKGPQLKGDAASDKGPRDW
jgi:hypothetical protein